MIDINLDTAATQTAAPAPTKPLRREVLTHIEGNNYLFVVDNSSMEKFTTCPVSAMNYLVYRREAHARNAALVFGGAIHQGLEVLLKGGDADAQAAAVVAHFESNPTPPDYRNVGTALEVLAHYRARAVFPDYEWEILRDTAGAPLVELPFELPLGVLDVNAEIQLPSWDEPRFVETISLAWSGKMDAIAECNSRVRVVDHKTTSIAGDQFVQDFKLSNQTIGYVWAANQLYPELGVSGFCGNAIHLKRPGLGKAAHTGGLLDRGPRGGEPPLSFFRFYFEYSPERLARWEENAKLLCSDFLHCLVRGAFPAHTKWCFAKYGRCSYHDVCSIDDERVAHNLLMSDAFAPVTWDPTN